MMVSGRSISPWADSVKMPTYPALAGNTTADVCVIGGGIAGLTCALLLAREGKRVVVLEKKELASGETSHTTAHCTAVLDDRFYDIEDTFGAEATLLAALSHREAIDKIEEIAKQENIECDFIRLDGYLFSPSVDSNDEISKELDTITRLGLMPVERLEKAPLKNYTTGACLRFPNQAQFHPLKYLAGVAQTITKYGGVIFTNTTVTKLDDASPVTVHTNNGATVIAGEVIVATNSPINDPIIMHIKQSPYRTYVIGARVPANSVQPGLYWDTEDPYHYVRLQKATANEGTTPDYDLLIVGGEDHKTGQADDAETRYRNLEAWTKARFPDIKEIEFRWSGQVQETVDGLAYIGRQPNGNPHIFIATGDSGMGMTHGTIAGMLLTDLIMGRKNARQQIFDPSRIMLGAAGEFVKEGLNVASQYLDWLTTGDSSDKVQLPRDSGTIVSRGLNKIALYRDQAGSVHACSAVCTHLKCIVAWNSSEKSWDCPCHGSRFDPYGRVITGPAIKDLKPLKTRPRED